MAYIQVIQKSEAEGRLREIYEDLIRTRGQLAEVHKIQSLNPETIVKHMELYMEIMYSNSPLSRKLREMIAVIVSAANKCHYCIRHHAEALNHFFKDSEKVNQIIKDFRHAGLSESELLLCEYAEKLTLAPHSISKKDVDRLKLNEISDRMVLDTALVVSYFNYVNRMVLGLGVELEEDRGAGYKFE